MNIKRGVVLCLLSLAAAASAAVGQQASKPIAQEFASSGRLNVQRSVAHADNSRIHRAYGRLPLLFQANRGQTDSSVRFVSRGDGYSLFLTGDEAVLSLRNRATTGFATDSSPLGIRMKLRAASPAVKLSGAGEVNGESNYFLGND